MVISCNIQISAAAVAGSQILVLLNTICKGLYFFKCLAEVTAGLGTVSERQKV